MPQGPQFSQEDQSSLTERLREWIHQERERGIPMENILISCGECGLLGLVDEPGDEEIPDVSG
ncbi:MAG: hypothetical protein V3V56_01010 [bacterium]